MNLKIFISANGFNALNTIKNTFASYAIYNPFALDPTPLSTEEIAMIYAKIPKEVDGFLPEQLHMTDPLLQLQCKLFQFILDHQNDPVVLLCPETGLHVETQESLLRWCEQLNIPQVIVYTHSPNIVNQYFDHIVLKNWQI